MSDGCCRLHPQEEGGLLIWFSQNEIESASENITEPAEPAAAIAIAAFVVGSVGGNIALIGSAFFSHFLRTCLAQALGFDVGIDGTAVGIGGAEQYAIGEVRIRSFEVGVVGGDLLANRGSVATAPAVASKSFSPWL